MTKKRKVRTSKEKFAVVLELLKGRKTQAQIATEYGVHPTGRIHTCFIKI